MATSTNIQVKIDLTSTEPKLEPEELEQLALNLAEDLKEITEYSYLIRESDIPQGSKPGLAGFIGGVLQTEVTLEGIQDLLRYLGERFFGKKLSLEFTANGKSYKLEYYSNQQLKDAVQAIKQLTQLD